MTTAFAVPAGVLRARADKTLAAAHPEHSRTAFQRAFAAGRVLRAGRPLESSDSVSAGEIVEFSFPELLPANLRAVAIPLDVLFEDRHLVVVNKPAGMVVHPGAGTGENTLVHALLAHCRGGLSGIGGVERPGIVHRLDRDTSGVIVAAKSDKAHRGLATQFSERSLHKEYLALVAGVPRLDSGIIRRPIGRNPRRRHTMTVVEEGTGGRDARTDWEVAERFGTAATLLRCVIHTGRTHQIRVHLKSLGVPIVGDRTYGWRAAAGSGAVAARPMLHAARLVASHPVTGKALDLKAPLAADFEALLAALRKGLAGAPRKGLAGGPMKPRRRTGSSAPRGAAAAPVGKTRARSLAARPKPKAKAQAGRGSAARRSAATPQRKL